MKWYHLKGNLTKLVKNKKLKPENNVVAPRLENVNKIMSRSSSSIGLKNNLPEENVDISSLCDVDTNIEGPYDDLQSYRNHRKANSLDNILLNNIQRDISFEGYPELFFLRSLIPDLQKMNAEQQHEFRIRTLGIIGDILYSSQCHTNPDATNVSSSSDRVQHNQNDLHPGPSNISSSSCTFGLKKYELFDNEYNITPSMYFNTESENNKISYLNLSRSDYTYNFNTSPE